MTDWLAIKNEYVVGSDRVTHRSLAVKYGLKDRTVDKRAQREGWTQLRKEYRDGVSAEVQQVAKTFDIDTMEKKLKDDARIFKVLKPKALADVTGTYPEGTEPKGQILKCTDLLAIMKAESNLIAYVYGEEPVPDQVNQTRATIQVELLKGDDKREYFKLIRKLQLLASKIRSAKG